MKLMFFVENYPPDINVSSVRLSEIVNTFSKHPNIDVKIVVYNIKQKTHNKNKLEGLSDNISISRHDRKFLPKILYIVEPINPIILINSIIILLYEIIRYNPDIIITTIPSTQPTIATYFITRFFKISHCIDFRDNWITTKIENYFVSSYPYYSRFFIRIIYLLYYKLLLCACKKAMLISIVYESMKDDLLKITNYKVPIIYIPNGVNLSELIIIKKTFNKDKILKKYCIPDNSSIIVYAGMVGGYYRPEILIKPLKELNLAGKKICYIIIGDGNLINKILKMVKKEGLENNIFLLGKKNHDEVLELLLSSDIAFYALDKTFPNAENALGTKILEYIACKLPILSIANSESSVSKIISEHNLGISLTWDRIDDIKEIIMVINESKVFKENLEKYNLEFLNEFDREKNNNKLFNEIIKQFDN